MKKSRTFAIALIALTALMTLVPVPEASAQTYTIKICKRTTPTGGTGFLFSWGNGSGNLPSFSLNDTQCNNVDVTTMDKFNKFTEIVPAGWTLTNIVCNSTKTVVNIIGGNPNPGFQPGDNTVTLDLIEPNVTCTFFNQRSSSGKGEVCVLKFDDKNGNGVRDTGEPGLPGWTFQIKDGSGNIVTTMITGPQGTTCTGVPAPGTYTVSEVPQSGWTPTVPPAGSQTVTVSNGQIINLSFGNQSSIDPCCPPWNTDTMKDMLFYQGQGSISAPYTLHFQPTTAFKDQMQAYINYLHAGNSLRTAITLAWRLHDQGTGTQIGSTAWTTWNWNTTGIGAPVFITPGFFAGFPMQVGTWYRIHTGMYLEGGQTFFPDKCAVNEILVRIQVIGAKTSGRPVLEFSDGKKVIKTVPIQ